MEQERNPVPEEDLRDLWLAECFHLDSNGEPLWPRQSFMPFGEWLAVVQS